MTFCLFFNVETKDAPPWLNTSSRTFARGFLAEILIPRQGRSWSETIKWKRPRWITRDFKVTIRCSGRSWRKCSAGPKDLPGKSHHRARGFIREEISQISRISSRMSLQFSNVKNYVTETLYFCVINIDTFIRNIYIFFFSFIRIVFFKYNMLKSDTVRAEFDGKRISSRIYAGRNLRIRMQQPISAYLGNFVSQDQLIIHRNSRVRAERTLRSSGTFFGGGDF